MILPEPLSFQWDKANINKNLVKHNVSNEEIEEAFFDLHKRVLTDHLHSNKENRHIVLGRTSKKRLLFIVFTVRNDTVRVISARDLNRKERYLYEKTT